MEISPILERHITRVEVRYVNGVRVEHVWTPDNADSEKTEMNRELVSREYVDEKGIKKTLTINQAINRRIEQTKIKTIRKNQSKAIEIILSGSPETMNAMSADALNRWANESVRWAKEQWGEENIVSAVLHCDEKTPHIHMILVPIVQGESRRTASKKRKLAKEGKTAKQYQINSERLRLSANEVYTQPRLYAYHNSYAEKVGAHFGLERGIQAEPGSRRRHIDSIEYNRILTQAATEKQELLDSLTEDFYKAVERADNVERYTYAAEQQQKQAEARKLQAEKDAATKEAQVTELQKLIDSNNKVINEQVSDYYARKVEMDDRLMYYEQQLEVYRGIEKAIQEREAELKSLSSYGLFKLMEKIPEMIKKEVQDIVNINWTGELTSFEEFDDKVEGVPQKFVRICMKAGDHNYEFEVQESNGHVWKDGKWCTYRDSTEEVYMPELAAYFRQELLPETKAFVRSIYKKNPEQNVVWKYFGFRECRIIRDTEGGGYLLQDKDWDHSNVVDGKYVDKKWYTKKAFNSFEVLGEEGMYAFLKLTYDDGTFEYVNQFGTRLSSKQLNAIGLSGKAEKGLTFHV